MKKIIDGKCYNTDTAKLEGVYENNYPSNDFNWIREEFYRKKTGEFFIYAEGGSHTQYAERLTENNWSGGSEIIPLSYESAKKWAEKYISEEEYERLFGTISEDNERRLVSISISVSAHKKARRKASMREISLSEYIEKLILEDINKQDL